MAKRSHLPAILLLVVFSTSLIGTSKEPEKESTKKNDTLKNSQKKNTQEKAKKTPPKEEVKNKIETPPKHTDYVSLVGLKESSRDHEKLKKDISKENSKVKRNEKELTQKKSDKQEKIKHKNNDRVKEQSKNQKEKDPKRVSKPQATEQSPKKEEVTILSKTVEEISFKETDFSVVIRANEFRQGNMGFFKINDIPGKPKLDVSKITVRWNGKYTPIFPYRGSYLGVLAISPEHPKGVSYLDVEKEETEKTVIYKFPINIMETLFPERKMYNPLRVPKKYVIKEHSPETLEFIKKCEDKKQSVFAVDSDLRLSGNFVLPLDKIFVTSPFYVKRYYHPSHPGKPHGGVDLRGKPGVPIYAIQDGKVVISERMFYEGIFTVIDHGSKIFSLYMHQSRTNVKEGDLVKAGDKIGEVGSTGISTGPHLHLGLKVDGEILNPLSILELQLLK